MKGNSVVIMFGKEADELHAHQSQDFEDQYLSLCLRDTRIFNDQILPIKNDEMIQETSALQKLGQSISKRSTGYSMMRCFMMRRFINRIQHSRQTLMALKSQHLNIINDYGSDSAYLMKYIEQLARENLTINKLSQLFQVRYIMEVTKLFMIKLKISYIITTFKKSFALFLTKIPLIYPESRGKYLWDNLAFMMRLLLLTLIPLDIGFNVNFMFQRGIPLTILITFMIIIDFLLRINTMCFINGIAAEDRLQIFYYQAKSSIIGDLFTVLLLIKSMSYDDSFPFLLLGTFYQSSYVYEFSQRSDQTIFLTKSQKGFLNLFKLIINLLYILHIFSCVWFYISQLDVSDSWIAAKGLADEEWYTQYLESFYFGIVTMLTIGYGDNVPKNPYEKILIIIFILIACLWFSYSINFIGSIINDITQNQTERNKKLRVINKYFQRRKVPYHLQHQIKEYLNYRWKEEDEIDLQLEQDIIDQLSDELKEQLDKQAHQQFIRNSEFLQKNFSDELKQSLFKYIKRRIIEPYNLFTIKFDDQYNLCYIEQGEMIFKHQDEKQKGKIHAQPLKGRFFCVQDFIIDEQELKVYKAIGYVSLLTLNKDDFLNCLKDFPQDYQTYCQLKDKVIMSGFQENIKNAVLCPICNKEDHTLEQCQFIQYKPNREVIIKRFSFNKTQDRRKIKRKRKNKKREFNTLSDKQSVEDFANLFQNENPQCVDEQLILYLTPETQDLQEPMIEQFRNQDQVQESKMRFRSSTPLFKQRRTYEAIQQKTEEEVQTFEVQFQRNIEQLYHSLKDDISDPLIYKHFKQIEMVYLQQKHYELEQFDSVYIFENYYPNNNITNIIKEQELANSDWQKAIIKRFICYTFYPFLYVMKFQRVKRQMTLYGSDSKKSLKAKNNLKMIELRGTMQNRRQSNYKYIKFNQITPESPIKGY